ncbi:MAG: cation:proton antiporter, partial [Faecalibacterium sp.]
LNQLEIYFHSRSKRMSLSVAFVLLTVGLSMVTFDIGPIHCGFSLLLVCMMTGTVFCNICPTSDELMDRLDRWVSPVSILFFVLSGAELDLNILSDPLVLLIGVVYIAFRSLGKISGAFVSGRATRCSHNIQKYLGITCCRRLAWRWAWQPRPLSFPTATWCATSCSSRCWCMSW